MRVPSVILEDYAHSGQTVGLATSYSQAIAGFLRNANKPRIRLFDPQDFYAPDFDTAAWLKAEAVDLLILSDETKTDIQPSLRATLLSYKTPSGAPLDYGLAIQLADSEVGDPQKDHEVDSQGFVRYYDNSLYPDTMKQIKVFEIEVYKPNTKVDVLIRNPNNDVIDATISINRGSAQAISLAPQQTVSIAMIVSKRHEVTLEMPIAHGGTQPLSIVLPKIDLPHLKQTL